MEAPSYSPGSDQCSLPIYEPIGLQGASYLELTLVGLGNNGLMPLDQIEAGLL